MIKLKLDNFDMIWKGNHIIDKMGQSRVTKKGNVNIKLFYETLWNDAEGDFCKFVNLLDKIYLIEVFCSGSKMNNKRHKMIKCVPYLIVNGAAPIIDFTCVFEYLAHLAHNPELIKTKKQEKELMNYL